MSDKKLVYISLCLGCITISFNVAAISAVIPVISQALQVQDLIVSRVIPYYMVPYGVGALLYAPLTRYLSYRVILSVSMFLFSLATLFCGLAGDIHHLLVFRVAMGVTAAAIIPLGLMIIGEIFEKNIRGRLLGIFFGCSFFASLAGIMIAGLADWRWIFYIPALLGLITATSFCLLGGSKSLNKVHGVRVNYFSLFTHANIRNIFLFIFLISALYHGVHKWYGVYLSRIYGMDKLTISFYFILAAITGFFGQMIGGYLSDKKGRLFACYVGLGGLSLGSMALAFRYNSLTLALVIGLISMSWTIGHNGISTILTDFSDEHRPVMASLNSAIRFIGGGIGFFITSFFVGESFSATFFLIGTFMILLLMFLKRLVKL